MGEERAILWRQVEGRTLTAQHVQRGDPSLQQLDEGNDQARRPEVDAEDPLDEINLRGFDVGLGFLAQGFDVSLDGGNVGLGFLAQGFNVGLGCLAQGFNVGLGCLPQGFDIRLGGEVLFQQLGLLPHDGLGLAFGHAGAH